MKTLAKAILRLLGWKLLPAPKERPKRSIICIAPHTSNCEFFIGKLYHWAIGQRSGFLMKKEWFVFPFSGILKAMGGIPVNRGKKEDKVSQLAETIMSYDEIHIAIAPEGTRKFVEKWHKGFYYIALKAGIPIELALMDYGKKLVGILETFYPTGDVEKDLAYIQSRYHSSQAKFPKQYNDEQSE